MRLGAHASCLALNCVCVYVGFCYFVFRVWLENLPEAATMLKLDSLSLENDWMGVLLGALSMPP